MRPFAFANTTDEKNADEETENTTEHPATTAAPRLMTPHHFPSQVANAADRVAEDSPTLSSISSLSSRMHPSMTTASLGTRQCVPVDFDHRLVRKHHIVSPSDLFKAQPGTVGSPQRLRGACFGDVTDDSLRAGADSSVKPPDSIAQSRNSEFSTRHPAVGEDTGEHDQTKIPDATGSFRVSSHSASHRYPPLGIHSNHKRSETGTELRRRRVMTAEERRRARSCIVEGCNNYIVHLRLCFKHGVG